MTNGDQMFEPASTEELFVRRVMREVTPQDASNRRLEPFGIRVVDRVAAVMRRALGR